MDQIRNCLREICRGQFVKLHGMAGAGKSVLAAESVRNLDLMVNTLGSYVFWLTIGKTDKMQVSPSLKKKNVNLES